MTAKCIRNDGAKISLTIGKDYEILSNTKCIKTDFAIQIKNDAGIVFWYTKDRFELKKD